MEKTSETANLKSSISSIENPASTPSDAVTTRNIDAYLAPNGMITSTQSPLTSDSLAMALSSRCERLRIMNLVFPVQPATKHDCQSTSRR